MSRKESCDETLSTFVCMVKILAIGMREKRLQDQQSNTEGNEPITTPTTETTP